MPVYQQGKTPHNCTVHQCILGDVSQPLSSMAGHLEPMGWHSSFVLLSTVWPRRSSRIGRASAMNHSIAFYNEYVIPKQPAVRRGVFVHPVFASDSALQRVAGEWPVIVETQNRIIHEHREPFVTDWNFREFLNLYTAKPYYLITGLQNSLKGFIQPQRELWCTLFNYEEDRLWMSNGNTSSSLHFDTHEVIITQVFGNKTVFLWHPSNASHTYMEHSTRYGISPINVDKVDLLRFPKFAEVVPEVVHLQAGDQLYLPSLYYHQIVTPPGRNIMVSTEFNVAQDFDLPKKDSVTETFIAVANAQMARDPISSCS